MIQASVIGDLRQVLSTVVLWELSWKMKDNSTKVHLRQQPGDVENLTSRRHTENRIPDTGVESQAHYQSAIMSTEEPESVPFQRHIIICQSIMLHSCAPMASANKANRDKWLLKNWVMDGNGGNSQRGYSWKCVAKWTSGQFLIDFSVSVSPFFCSNVLWSKCV